MVLLLVVSLFPKLQLHNIGEVMQVLVGITLFLVACWNGFKLYRHYQHRIELNQLRKENKILHERNLDERPHITKLNITRNAKQLRKASVSRRASGHF
jgi:hypothetical protein